MEKFELVAKTLHGLEEVLANELKNIGAEKITVLKRAVSFVGDKSVLYKANYFIRTAISILKPISSFEVKNEDDLYRHISKIRWNHYMEINSTFLVTASVSSENFNHSKYVAYKTKDAIVDQFRRKTGKRPSIDLETPDLRINVHISKNNCNVSIDSSGDSLFKRGYRVDGHIAPLNEVLAAGMLSLSEWDGKKTFIDPMCGSGTLLIEAAMIATNTPAGFYRKEYGFQNWKDYDEKLFEEIKQDVDIKETINCEILGSDVSRVAFDITSKNLEKAGFRKLVKIKKAAFENLEPPKEGGIMIMNPPYGERITKEDINEFYSMIGSRLKHFYAGFNAWIISSNFEAIKHFGLRPSRKIVLFNGAMECKFLKFELYSGSRKNKKK